MRSTAAARRYAKALFSLARDENRVSEIQEEIDGLSALSTRVASSAKRC